MVCRFVRSMPYHRIAASVAWGLNPSCTGCFRESCRFFQYLRLRDREVFDNVHDAPGFGRRAEPDLRIGEAVELAHEPGFRHLEVRDEPLPFALRHRSAGGGLRAEQQ